MPNHLGYKMHLAYALAYVRAKLVRDHTFEMELLTWKQVHEAKDEDQTQEPRKARKQRTEAANHASRETRQKEGRPWEAGKQDGREAAKQESQNARQQGSRKRQTGKQRSREVVKRRDWEAWQQEN